MLKTDLRPWTSNTEHSCEVGIYQSCVQLLEVRRNNIVKGKTKKTEALFNNFSRSLLQSKTGKLELRILTFVLTDVLSIYKVSCKYEL